MENDKTTARRERVRSAVCKHREKIKSSETLRKEYQKRDAERKRDERRRKKLLLLQNKKEMKKERQKERERKQKYRQKIRQLKTDKEKADRQNLGPYNCRQTLGKALHKVKKVLPSSPNHRNTVVKHLVMNVAPSLLSSDRPSGVRKPGNLSITIEERDRVVDFFIRDDISRQAPGKRDTKSVKTMSGRRQVFQKRHMVMTVKEAFIIYKEQHPESIIKLSTFYNLRPPHVLLSSQTPHNVCICRYHANFSFLIEAIHAKCKTFPTTGSDLLSKVSCDTSNEKCMMSICAQCEYDLVYALLPISAVLNEDPDIPVIIAKWKQWENINGQVQMLTTEGPLQVAVNMLESQLKIFKTHCFVKTVQEQYFDFKKRNLEDREALMQIDFAENYSLISQDEIQAAHWCHEQVTIFTCVVWLNSSTYSFAVVSDDLSHSKFSVHAFMKTIIDTLRSASQQKVENLIVFSDGCAAQFKNKFTLSNLCYAEEDFGLSMEWNFFATSHGKGAVDAVGGLIKRLVWNDVRSKKLNINNALEFYECAKSKVKNIRVIFTDKAIINRCTTK